MATLLLVAALAAVVIGFLYRRMTRGDNTADSGLGGFTGEA